MIRPWPTGNCHVKKKKRKKKKKKKMMMKKEEPRHNDIDLCHISSTVSHIVWYQLIAWYQLIPQF